VSYYYRWEDFPEREVSYLKGRPESSKLLVRIMSSSKIMLTDVNAKKGGVVPAHHHEAEQIFLVYTGKMRVTTGKNAPREIGPGDIWVVPSNCSHSVEYIEDTTALEIVSPVRMDNFIGYTISHTFFEEDES
jgi:quercetin dioxygenase-like cupin family protein